VLDWDHQVVGSLQPARGGTVQGYIDIAS
jgi:hypothetical protein